MEVNIDAVLFGLNNSVRILQQLMLLHTSYINAYMYVLCIFCLMSVSAKERQDTFWKISIAANVLYYVSQVS